MNTISKLHWKRHPARYEYADLPDGGQLRIMEVGRPSRYHDGFHIGYEIWYLDVPLQSGRWGVRQYLGYAAYNDEAKSKAARWVGDQ